jgi:hypothetical protein
MYCASGENGDKHASDFTSAAMADKSSGRAKSSVVSEGKGLTVNSLLYCHAFFWDSPALEHVLRVVGDGIGCDSLSGSNGNSPKRARKSTDSGGQEKAAAKMAEGFINAAEKMKQLDDDEKKYYQQEKASAREAQLRERLAAITSEIQGITDRKRARKAGSLEDEQEEIEDDAERLEILKEQRREVRTKLSSIA